MITKGLGDFQGDNLQHKIHGYNTNEEWARFVLNVGTTKMETSGRRVKKWQEESDNTGQILGKAVWDAESGSTPVETVTASLTCSKNERSDQAVAS